MLVKIEARVLIFPGTDFHFPSTSVPPGTISGSAVYIVKPCSQRTNWTELNCNKSTQLHGASRCVHWSLIRESYTVIICQQSYLLIWYSITHSLFHSRLKTSLFCKSFPPQPFLFLFQDSPHDSPDCLLLFISISIFYVLVVLFLRILVVGSVR